jgi:hypothetical protein
MIQISKLNPPKPKNLPKNSSKTLQKTLLKIYKKPCQNPPKIPMQFFLHRSTSYPPIKAETYKIKERNVRMSLIDNFETSL